MKFVYLKYDLFYKIVPHSRRLQYHTVSIFSVYIYYSINETHFLSFCLTEQSVTKAPITVTWIRLLEYVTQSQHLYTPHDDENDEILADKGRERVFEARPRGLLRTPDFVLCGQWDTLVKDELQTKKCGNKQK